MATPDLRPANPNDLPAIAALDAECFGNPWTADVYQQELTRPFARLRVLMEGPSLLGLSCTWIVGDEAHLLRIVTRVQRRRGGLGRHMLGAVIDEAGQAGCMQVLLEVAASNTAARGLYEVFGFESVGVRRGYYTRPLDDAVVMRLALDPSRTGLG